MSAAERIDADPKQLTDAELMAEIARLDRARVRTTAFLRRAELVGEADEVEATARLRAVIAGRYAEVFDELRVRMARQRDLAEAVGLYLLGIDEDAS